MKEQKKKREYFRKCGFCHEKDNQKNMIRDDRSPNGWCCCNCWNYWLSEDVEDDF